jgi:hypothetical protein
MGRSKRGEAVMAKIEFHVPAAPLTNRRSPILLAVAEGSLS